jgi:hypothetical protein
MKSGFPRCAQSAQKLTDLVWRKFSIEALPAQLKSLLRRAHAHVQNFETITNPLLETPRSPCGEIEPLKKQAFPVLDQPVPVRGSAP